MKYAGVIHDIVSKTLRTAANVAHAALPQELIDKSVNHNYLKFVENAFKYSLEKTNYKIHHSQLQYQSWKKFFDLFAVVCANDGFYTELLYSFLRYLQEPLPIFLYHDITEKSKTEWEMSPVIFERDIKVIKSQYDNFEIHFDDGFKGVIKYALPILSKNELKATVFINPRYIMYENSREHIYMGIDDLRFLIKNGWEIGGHGWNHYDLSKLPIHEVEKEIKMCKEWIKKELNYEANKFAYPYGIYDMSIIQIVKKYFKFAYTIDNSFFQISRRIRKDVWR